MSEKEKNRKNHELRLTVQADCFTAEMTMTDSPMIQVDHLCIPCTIATEGVVRFLLAHAVRLGCLGLSFDLDLEEQAEHYLYHSLMDLGAQDRTPTEERLKAIDLVYLNYGEKEEFNDETCPF